MNLDDFTREPEPQPDGSEVRAAIERARRTQQAHERRCNVQLGLEEGSTSPSPEWASEDELEARRQKDVDELWNEWWNGWKGWF